VSNATNDRQDKYVSISKAMSILNVRFERITWFIATGELSSKPDPQDKSRKVVSLQDVRGLYTLPHLLAPWVIYALVDPRNGAIRYVGRAYEPQVRLRQHLNDVCTSNPAKYRWLRELKRSDLRPRMEILEGVEGTLQDADARERVWIRHFLDNGADLTNIQYMSE